MTFGAAFPRVMRPAFGPGLAAAAAAATWWTAGGATGCVAAYQPKGAASQAASYVNLANPGTYDLTVPGAAPGWNTATGWTFTGGDVLSTGIAEGAGVPSVLVRITNGVNLTVCGPIGASTKWSIQNDYYGGRRYVFGGALFIAGGAVYTGTMGFAGTTAYLNGASDGAIPGGTFSSNKIKIGEDGVTNYYQGDIIAAAIYGVTLTGPQMLAVSTAMAAL